MAVLVDAQGEMLDNIETKVPFLLLKLNGGKKTILTLCFY